MDFEGIIWIMSEEILPKTLIQNFFAEKLVKSTETAAFLRKWLMGYH